MLFLFTFSGIFALMFVNFAKFVKICKNIVVDFIFKDKKVLLIILI